MWPTASANLLTTVTVTSAKSHLVLQGDPRTWEAGRPPRELLTAPRVPFARVRCLLLPCDSVVRVGAASQAILQIAMRYVVLAWGSQLIFF